MVNYTKNQEEVVLHDSGNIVVTASAGSGKTKVMIDRLIRLIEKGKASVDEVLAVTYTTLAASEFREKLSKAIKSMIANGKKEEKSRFKKELEKLPLAQISTVHSFCAQIIKKYFYVISVDPSFSILTDQDKAIIKQRSIDDVFEKLYEEKDEDILTLLSSYVQKRSDRDLKKKITRIHEVVYSKLDPNAYFDKSINSYTLLGAKDAENRLIAPLFERITACVNNLSSLIQEAKALDFPKYVEYIEQIVCDYEYLKKDLNKSNLLWFSSAERNFPSIKIAKDDIYRLEYREKLNSAKKAFEKINAKCKALDELEIDEEELEREQKILKGFKKVVNRFEEEYFQKKKDLSLYDFNDLERFCYQILQNEDAREEIASSYKYIFVDEYQDTNEIQESIFSLLEKNNLFVVGDLKQSIYGFRGSKPELFKKRLNRERQSGGTTKELETNFRSSRAVIDAVNKVFSRVMTSEVDINYKDCPMVCGELLEQNGKVIYHQFVKEKTEKTTYSGVYGVLKHIENLKEEQAVGIEVLIRKIVEDSLGKEFFDPKTKENRKISFGDIAILTRSNLNGKIANELVRAGIPVVSEAQQEIKDYPEIVMLANLISLIATSGRDDIALITILKTVVAEVCEREMQKIRKISFEGSFYDACQKYLENNSDEISKKLKKFFSYIERLNLLSNFEGVATLISRVFKETRLDMEILSTRFGEMRSKRVECFLAACENGGNELTAQEFLDKKESILDDITIAFSNSTDAVRLLTIHKSKGLEFPVVILADIDGDMHTKNARQEIIFDDVFGMSVFSKDPVSKVKKNNVIRACALEGLSKEAIKGEMRLLYVAMTRAILDLHIVSTKKLKDNYQMAQVQSIADYFCAGDFECEEVLASDLQLSNGTLRPREIIYGDDFSKEFEEIKKFVGFKYPFEKDTSLDLKISVTEATKKIDFDDEGEKVKQFFSASIDEGVLYHTFLEHTSFDEKNIDNEVIALLSLGKISKDDVKSLNKETLKKILSHPIFDLVKEYDRYPEQQFVCHYPPKVLGLEGETNVLVQGIIDLLLVKNGKAIIIDYKYSGADKETLKNRYFKQLELYAYAVEKVLKLKVERAVLFNIKSQETVEII